MRGALLHLKIRAGMVLTSPGGWIAFSLTALATLFYWPSSIDLIQFGAARDLLDSTAPTFLWLWLLPMVVCQIASGRPVHRRRDPNQGLGALPSLPVAARWRTVAEAALVLGLLVGLRLLLWPLSRSVGWVAQLPGTPGNEQLGSYLGWSVWGALILAPTTLAWVGASVSLDRAWVRSVAVAVLACLAVQLSVKHGPILGAGLVLVLLAVQLGLMGRPAPELGWIGRSRRSRRSCFRPAMAPERRFLRDHWTRLVPYLGAYALALMVVLLTRGHGFHQGAMMAGVLAGILGGTGAVMVIKPMGSSLVMSGLVGKHGFEAGDYLRAWSVLPVRPEPVLRGVYLHGLLTSLTIWGTLVAGRLIQIWLRTGAPGLDSSPDRDFTRLVLPMVVLAPGIASGLVSAAAGANRRAYISLGSCVLLLHGYFLAQLMLPPGLLWPLFTLISITAMLPGLPLLRRGWTARSA